MLVCPVNLVVKAKMDSLDRRERQGFQDYQVWMGDQVSLDLLGLTVSQVSKETPDCPFLVNQDVMAVQAEMAFQVPKGRRV